MSDPFSQLLLAVSVLSESRGSTKTGTQRGALSSEGFNSTLHTNLSRASDNSAGYRTPGCKWLCLALVPGSQIPGFLWLGSASSVGWVQPASSLGTEQEPSSKFWEERVLLAGWGTSWPIFFNCVCGGVHMSIGARGGQISWSWSYSRLRASVPAVDTVNIQKIPWF